ncbi:hypothetical protein [Methylobacterium sp. B4]|uniref:hypothetical protein n=1 Tax=Methylobacterium sp. B4 TaxID=1938755 RepID=UPI000D76AAC8|nr:hypothetical protein [Methylobacterium sp. B4]PXW59821.1 hypothetical protein BY998_11039 [Methylobacterium sp. B4]
MSVETLRQQGADACRAYFAELGDDFTELTAAGRGDMVMMALTARAITSASEAVGIHDAANMQTFAEGFVKQANAEIQVLRGKLLITPTLNRCRTL